MKGISTKLFFTPVLFFVFTCAWAQTGGHKCGTVSLPASEKISLEKMVTKIMAEQPVLQNQISGKNMKIANTGTSCIPIKVHDIRDGAGSGAVNMTLLNQDLANLNYHFQAANIEFYFCGTVSALNNDTHYDFLSANESALLTAEPSVTNAFNLYLVNSIDAGSGIAGYAYFPFNNLLSTVCIMDKNELALDDNGTIVHEYGHHFNLYHTHEGTENGNNDPAAENVPRSGAGSNCTTAGDLLCDTEADPRGTSSNCVYTGGGVNTMDILGNPYTPPLDNIMSYYPNQCGGLFTAGQSARIVAARTIRNGHSAYTLNCPATVVNAASGLAAVQSGSQVNLSWTDNAANELGYLVERSTTSAATGFSSVQMGGVAANATAFSDNTVASNTTYWYRIKASNGDCNTYSNVATVTTGLIYCVPTYVNNCSGATIDIFTFTGNTNINNNTTGGCAAPSYTDYSATISADVTAGTTYSFSVTKSTTNSRYVQLYIDFNRDGDFLDASETILPTGDTPVPNFTYTGTNAVTVPPTATNGTTRMRVILKNSTGGAITSACETNMGFGEAEDYALNISGGALPVEFLSFAGKLSGASIILDWSTAREVGNDHFELERSFDGELFSPIATIKGTASASEVSTYEYTDESPSYGKNFYRLKQVDFDKDYVYSSIISVDRSAENSEVKISPNPVSSQLYLDFSASDEEMFSIDLLDLAGRNLHSEKLTSAIGFNKKELSVQSISPGIYVLRVMIGEKLNTFRIVKQ